MARKEASRAGSQAGAPVVGRTVADSVPWWPQPERASGPNILIVLLDDVGFAQLGCYGGASRTLAMDSLAAEGLRFTNFHVPALCSPTRASLLTGRNHHAVGMGFLGAYDTGFPGYRARIDPAAGTIAEVLGDAGYGCYAVGKWHLTPPREISPAGPFRNWPTGRGFHRFYGFLRGEEDQFSPELWQDQHFVEIGDDPDYHLTEDLVDRALGYIDDHLTSRPEDPFLCYLALGAAHAPHQAPPEYLQRQRGRFDHGWDEERRRVLERQKASGLVPQEAELAPATPDVPDWDSLEEDERIIATRLQEAFAAFMEHTDDQLGRLLAQLRERGVLDDTVVLLLSDNGASGEGGRLGTANQFRTFLGLDDSAEETMAALESIGGPEAHNHYPAGWAQAGNAPFRWFKRHTHGGGARTPLLIRWPGGIDDPGSIRDGFVHVTDLMPTLLELAGVEQPEQLAGIEQLPVHGISQAAVLGSAERAAAAADEQRPRSQYFETVGHRGIWADGWKAVVSHATGSDFAEDRWELYHLDEDFAECHDLAAEHPERLAELIELWEQQAAQNQVFPLDDRMGPRSKSLDPATDLRHYRMYPGTRLPNHVIGPSFTERPFTITGRFETTAEGPDDGVILAYGGAGVGFSLFVLGGVLEADLNYAGRHVSLIADRPAAGASELALQLRGGARGPEAVLLLDGREAASAALPRFFPGGIGMLSTQCGYNAPSAVSKRYRAPFRQGPGLRSVDIELGDRVADPSAQDWISEAASQ